VSGAREGSKTVTVVALLERKGGATLAEIMKATGSEAHCVRGFVSGTLGKKMGPSGYHDGGSAAVTRATTVPIAVPTSRATRVNPPSGLAPVISCSALNQSVSGVAHGLPRSCQRS
jgi:hypothetical protein